MLEKQLCGNDYEDKQWFWSKHHRTNKAKCAFSFKTDPLGN